MARELWLTLIDVEHSFKLIKCECDTLQSDVKDHHPLHHRFFIKTETDQPTKKSQAEVKVEEALGGWYWFWFGLWFDFNSNHASRTCRIVLFEQLIMRWVINYIFKLIPLVFLFFFSLILTTNSFVIRFSFEFSVIVIVFFLQHYFIWFSFPFTVDKFLPAINY